jgi:hypothetical protein
MARQHPGISFAGKSSGCFRGGRDYDLSDTTVPRQVKTIQPMKKVMVGRIKKIKKTPGSRHYWGGYHSR